ncbi:MAG: hypothetical protein ACPGWR_32670, partial [Ardenticatenaceae bacterium]
VLPSQMNNQGCVFYLLSLPPSFYANSPLCPRFREPYSLSCPTLLFYRPLCPPFYANSPFWYLRVLPDDEQAGMRVLPDDEQAGMRVLPKPLFFRQ